MFGGMNSFGGLCTRSWLSKYIQRRRKQRGGKVRRKATEVSTPVYALSESYIVHPYWFHHRIGWREIAKMKPRLGEIRLRSLGFERKYNWEEWDYGPMGDKLLRLALIHVLSCYFRWFKSAFSYHFLILLRACHQHTLAILLQAFNFK